MRFGTRWRPSGRAAPGGAQGADGDAPADPAGPGVGGRGPAGGGPAGGDPGSAGPTGVGPGQPGGQGQPAGSPSGTARDTQALDPAIAGALADPASPTTAIQRSSGAAAPAQVMSRRTAAEVGMYAGAALIGVAVGAVLLRGWSVWSDAMRLGLSTLTAVALTTIGLAVRLSGPQAVDASRRRAASVLLTAGASLVLVALAVVFDVDVSGPVTRRVAHAAVSVALMAGVVRVARSPVSEAGLLGAAAWSLWALVVPGPWRWGALISLGTVWALAALHGGHAGRGGAPAPRTEPAAGQGGSGQGQRRRRRWRPWPPGAEGRDGSSAHAGAGGADASSGPSPAEVSSTRAAAAGESSARRPWLPTPAGPRTAAALGAALALLAAIGLASGPWAWPARAALAAVTIAGLTAFLRGRSNGWLALGAGAATATAASVAGSTLGPAVTLVVAGLAVMGVSWIALRASVGPDDQKWSGR